MEFKKQLIALNTMIHKELRRIIRIWAQTLLPPVITTLLYFIIFGGIIGKRIGTMDGLTYIKFIAPGLIMLSIINSAYSATVSSFFSAKFQRSIEEMLVSPVHNVVILFGYMFGGIIRAILIGMLVGIIALFFTKLKVYSYIDIIAVAIVSASIFSLGGIINAIYSTKFDDIAIIPTFILTPLTYLGGVFYSISLLPKFWQYVSLANPIIYIVNAFRFGFLGISDEYVIRSFGIMLFCAIALFLFALHLLNKGTGLKS